MSGSESLWLAVFCIFPDMIGLSIFTRRTLALLPFYVHQIRLEVDSTWWFAKTSNS